MIIIDNIVKKYGQTLIFDHYSTQMPLNQTTLILGKSGIGKTTLLHAIADLISLDAGTIKGIDCLKKAMVFQEDRLVNHLNAIKNIQLVNKKLADKYISAELTKVGFDLEQQLKPVAQHSGGMKQRVTILRALLSNWDILLLDEPFKQLDMALKADLIDYTKQHIKNKTVIMVTHDMMVMEAFKGCHVICLD